jgi:hypothetical protein
MIIGELIIIWQPKQLAGGELRPIQEVGSDMSRGAAGVPAKVVVYGLPAFETKEENKKPVVRISR